MEATAVSGRIDVPITTGTIVILALAGLWALHKISIQIG